MFRSWILSIRKVQIRSNIKCFEYFGQPTIKYLSSDFLYLFTAVILVIISAKLFGCHKYPNRLTASIKCWMYHHWLFYYFFKEEADSKEFEFDASIFYHENNLNEVEIIYQFLKLVSKELNHSAILCMAYHVK